MWLSNRNLATDLGVPGSHADHLDLLKEFSFSANRWRNDDFCFLEFPEIGSPDISHAGCNRSDQILTSVVYVRGTEEDLSQRASGSNSDSRPTRQIGVRCRHAPMVPFARRFNRFCKGAADHDRVCAASKRFADVASLAHSAIRDDRDIVACLLVIV